jgi:putative transposase
MPRKIRICFQNFIHHIMFRGVNGDNIFFDDRDRVRFCLLLQEASESHGFVIHGFCLMTNHVHLLLEPLRNSLEKGIHAFSFRYAQFFNRRHKRRGYLFQGRYKSILVEDGDYIKRVIRYIHLNPVEANIVQMPENYRWSSYRGYIGLDEYIWLQTERVLRQFDLSEQNAVNSFMEYTRNRLDNQLSLGDISKAFRYGVFGLENKKTDINQKKIESENHIPEEVKSLEDLTKYVCKYFNVGIEELKSSSKLKRVIDARSVLAFIARSTKQWSIEQLAKSLNKNSGTLSRLASRVENQPELISLIKDSNLFHH